MARSACPVDTNQGSVVKIHDARGKTAFKNKHIRLRGLLVIKMCRLVKASKQVGADELGVGQQGPFSWRVKFKDEPPHRLPDYLTMSTSFEMDCSLAWGFQTFSMKPLSAKEPPKIICTTQQCYRILYSKNPGIKSLVRALAQGSVSYPASSY